MNTQTVRLIVIMCKRLKIFRNVPIIEPEGVKKVYTLLMTYTGEKKDVNLGVRI